MAQCKIGTSTLSDARQAGEQAAQQATAGLSEIKLLLVYSSVDYNLDQMLDGITRAAPNTSIIGNTSFTGIVTPDGFVSGDNGFVGVMSIAGSDVCIGTAASPKAGSARETGRMVAEQAMKKAGRNDAPAYFYMAASPGEEEYYLKGISDVIGRVPFFGGSAADNSIAGEWSIYGDAAVFGDGVAVAFFYTDQVMTNLFTGAYRETEQVGIITKVVNDRVLAEIDGVPALRKYADWAGVEPDSLKGGDLLVYTITSPLGVKDRLGDLTAIRHPMNGNDDYSMNIGANLAEKTAVIRMEATVDELIASASDTLAQLREKCPHPPAAFHLVHCGGRRAGIGVRIDEVANAVRLVSGDVPFIMEFTFGEYGFEDDGNNTTGGLMLSYTAIY